MSTPVLEKLFTEYEKAFALFGAKRISSFYADRFMGAGPKGVQSYRNNFLFLRGAKQGFKLYENLGMHSVKSEFKETPISDDFSLATVHYTVKFRKTGETVVPFDLTYIVNMIEREPKIILFISHRDEREALHDLGLLPEKSRGGGPIEY